MCAIAQARVSVADGPPFIGHLRQGTVELIGITYYRPTGQARWWNRVRWWRADGSAAQIDPFRPQGTHVLQMFADMKTLTFLVRVTLPPDRSRADQYVPSLARSSDPYAPSDPSPSDRYVPPEQSSRAQVGYGESTADASWPAWEFSDPPHWRNPTPRRWQGFEVADARGNISPDLRMVSVHFDAYTESADFRVSVSTSAYQWETVITRKSNSAGTWTFLRDGREWPVAFQKARETPKATEGSPARTTQVRLMIPHDEIYGKLKTRLVAIDNDGKEHASVIDSVENRGTAVFSGLPLSSIKEFQFQVRPYDWVEFKNVSLQPGRATIVRVVSSVDSTNAEK